MQSGIYSITHIASGRHYIGSAVDLERRWQRHQHDLMAQRHHNSKLQRAWNKYGVDAFRFDVKELVEPDGLIAREQFWMDSTNPFYNALRIAGSAKGYQHTDEAKAKNSAVSRAYWANMTPEQKQAKLTHFENSRPKNHSEETKRKMSEAHKGKQLTATQLANLELRHTPEARAKRALANSKAYIVTTPDGKELEVVNLSAFCREHGLAQGHLAAVARGERKHHRGYVARNRT